MHFKSIPGRLPFLLPFSENPGMMLTFRRRIPVELQNCNCPVSSDSLLTSDRVARYRQKGWLTQRHFSRLRNGVRFRSRGKDSGAALARAGLLPPATAPRRALRCVMMQPARTSATFHYFRVGAEYIRDFKPLVCLDLTTFSAFSVFLFCCSTECNATTERKLSGSGSKSWAVV